MARSNPRPKSTTSAPAAAARDQTAALVRTLQTEFKGKTPEEIRRAIAHARARPSVRASPTRVLEVCRVLLGAGVRG